jgi:hypothetical protein
MSTERMAGGTMTEKLTIKDLNCGNCPFDGVADKDDSCPFERVCIKTGMTITESMESFIAELGCASHPLALQVLAAPVIEELERLKTEARKEHDCAQSYGFRLDRRGKVDALELAIKLLKEGVKKP